MEDRHGVPEDPQSPASTAERDEMTMELLNRHRLVSILRSVYGATLSPRPKTVRRDVEDQPPLPSGTSDQQSELHRKRGEVDLQALLAEAQRAPSGPAVTTKLETIDPPAAPMIDTWLANNLYPQLEAPVLQVGGRLLGYMPLVVTWPDQLDGHWFDFNRVAIDVVPQLRQNSDCLALIRRLNLYRQVAFRFRDGDFRFLVVSSYVEPGLKYLLEGQGITVYETR